MTTPKITERDIYTSILEGTVDMAVLREFAEKKLGQLDHRNEKAKERAAAKRAEGDELLEVVAGFVTDEPQTREDITNAMIAAGHEVTAGKVGYRLTVLTREGRIQKAEATVPGENGNKRVMVYATEFETE